MKSFEIRTYGFSELAMLYFPDYSPNNSYNAWRKLKRWIKSHPKLKRALVESGFGKGSYSFTPHQVELIVDCFGEP